MANLAAATAQDSTYGLSEWIPHLITYSVGYGPLLRTFTTRYTDEYGTWCRVDVCIPLILLLPLAFLPTTRDVDDQVNNK